MPIRQKNDKRAYEEIKNNTYYEAKASESFFPELAGLVNLVLTTRVSTVQDTLSLEISVGKRRVEFGNR